MMQSVDVVIATAIKQSELDCGQWPASTCRELADEITAALAAAGFVIITATEYEQINK